MPSYRRHTSDIYALAKQYTRQFLRWLAELAKSHRICLLPDEEPGNSNKEFKIEIGRIREIVEQLVSQPLPLRDEFGITFLGA